MAPLHAPIWRIIDVPVYGNPGDVDQIEVELDAPPDASDDDLPDWQDVPELWNQDYPGIDYDHPRRSTYLCGTE